MKIHEPTNGVLHAPRENPQEPSGLKTAGIAAVVEFLALCPDLEDGLGDLFEALKANGDEEFFHPHTLTREEASRRCCYRGPDLYYAATCSGEVAAYGLLRGWEQGYEVPSLGIAVSPSYRGRGLARPFMVFLHAAAHLRGAPSIRLTVYESNVKAKELYRSLGYTYERLDGKQLIGRLDLYPGGEFAPRCHESL
jgi:[ribosomal protein S18]-alanine N-acetyltransferase